MPTPDCLNGSLATSNFQTGVNAVRKRFASQENVVQIRGVTSIKTFMITSILAILSFASVLSFQKFAIDESLQYRQLANGWVSIYAEIYTNQALGVVEKIKRAISADIAHGRFRPLFFIYSSLSYIVSPWVHERYKGGEERVHRLLMNGDLRIFSSILLASISFSLLALSSLVYQSTGSWLFLIIPIFFIPLSPTVSENLLQNYIDSQEIPLILFLSIWLSSLTWLIRLKNHLSAKLLLALLSAFALIAGFLTKETAVVVTVALAGLVAALWIYRKISPSTDDSCLFKYLRFSLIVSLVMTLLVITVVKTHSQGYSTAYEVKDFAKFVRAMRELWSVMSLFTLHNWFGFIPIGIAYLIFFIGRGTTVYGKSMSYHFAITSLLVILSYGFLLILSPWDVILPKYVYPSIIFFSFSVAYALALISAWLKERNTDMTLWIVCGAFIPYLFLYATYYESAVKFRNDAGGLANFGVTVIPSLADSIEKHAGAAPGKRINVFLGFADGRFFDDHVTWGKLQLQRWLNLKKGFNIIERDNKVVLNLNMPAAELTSFSSSSAQKDLYVSKRPEVFGKGGFDVVYYGYTGGEEPEKDIGLKDIIYRITDETIIYSSTIDKPGFVIYKYLPLVHITE